MRITYIGFLLGHGGDALLMLDLAVGAQAAGATVNIIVPALASSAGFARRCEERGVACERSDLITADMHMSRQKLVPLLRMLRANRPDVIHFHTGDYCLPRLAIVAMAILHLPRAMVTIHSPEHSDTPVSARGLFWARSAKRRFSAVISPSRHGREFQMRLGVPPEICRTIYNGVDIDRFSIGDAMAARQHLDVAAHAPLLVFSSRLDEQKRPLDALRILEALSPQHDDAVLVFVGSGDLAGRVEAEAAALGLTDRVRLVGYQTGVADWLHAAAAWILPTSTENFSVALLEALAAGCPIVATSCPGNDEVLIDGDNACTFKIGDIATAAKHVDRILSDAPFRAGLSASARATARRFTVQGMVDRHLSLYESATGRPIVAEATRTASVGS